jgi:hypothetical protein
MINTTTQPELTLGPAPSVAEVAELFNLHPSVVYRMIYAGKLEVICGFGRLRVCPKSIDRFLKRSTTYKPKKTRGRRAKASKAEVAV